MITKHKQCESNSLQILKNISGQNHSYRTTRNQNCELLKIIETNHSHAIARSLGILGEPGGLLGLDGFRTLPRSNAVC